MRIRNLTRDRRCRPAFVRFGRQGVSLCGAKSPTPLATRLFIPPSGGASGCWTPRVQEDAFASPRFAGLRAAVLAAEKILQSNAAYRETPVPVRFRSSVSAGPGDEGGAAIHVKAAPERTASQRALGDAPDAPVPRTFELGTPAPRVRALQGAPFGSRDDHWDYGPSWVQFRCGVVSGWYSSPLRPLKVASSAPPVSSEFVPPANCQE